jgi:hypothetical protein
LAFLLCVCLSEAGSSSGNKILAVSASEGLETANGVFAGLAKHAFATTPGPATPALLVALGRPV